MFSEWIHAHPYLTIGIVSLLINIPMGYVRETAQKFSGAWFFWIHASIPLIVYLRITLNTSKLFIPVCIALAIIGQLAGSRCRRRRSTVEEIETYERIGDLRLPQRPAADRPRDEDIMVVLLNMGGPRTNADVPAFQKRLFGDPLLIRFPLSGLLQPFFAWLLVTLRGKAAQRRYQLIGGGSPIFASTDAQSQALREALRARGRGLDVIFSFNYSHPSPEEAIREIKTRQKRYILPISLYPHYSSATTGSNLHYLREAAGKMFPRLRFLAGKPYYLHDGYIQAFVDRIREQVRPGESLDDFYLIFSAHGLPLYFLHEGDPYAFQIAQTVAKIVDTLKRRDNWIISYQSAVGPLQWLKPSTEQVIKALARRGIERALVVPISFVTDHIETLCEIDIEYRHFAGREGIRDFRMSRAVECHEGFIRALRDTVEEALPAEIFERLRG
jgi:ferrochelatase